ncbi:MAG: hypothetical protein H7336_12900 [Bacteriovorax sp.]|nr:hypothetical protein [Bacteriovorax sp.]
MKTFLMVALFISSIAHAQDFVDGQETKVGGKKVIYTYKQYEKFDFDDLNIEGDTGSPSDISISPIHEKRFTNRLPYRKSFTVEIKKGIERVR